MNEENNEEAGEHFTPRDAIILLSQLIFEPIKDKILCITHGNHENRTYKQEGINLSLLMALINK